MNQRQQILLIVHDYFCPRSKVLNDINIIGSHNDKNGCSKSTKPMSVPFFKTKSTKNANKNNNNCKQNKKLRTLCMVVFIHTHTFDYKKFIDFV
jgi:hypothetical protein